MFTGITSKIEQNADKLGYAAGLLALPQALAGDALGHWTRMVQALMTSPHVPNIDAMLHNLMSGNSLESKFFIGGIEAYVVGYFLDELGIHPTLTKLGKIAKKAGIATTEATAGFTLLEYCGMYQT